MYISFIFQINIAAENGFGFVTLTIDITVNDVADSPIFTSPVYSIGIAENTLPGTKVLDIGVHDYDEGQTGSLILNIKGMQTADIVLLLLITYISITV